MDAYVYVGKEGVLTNIEANCVLLILYVWIVSTVWQWLCVVGCFLGTWLECACCCAQGGVGGSQLIVVNLTGWSWSQFLSLMKEKRDLLGGVTQNRMEHTVAAHLTKMDRNGDVHWQTFTTLLPARSCTVANIAANNHKNPVMTYISAQLSYNVFVFIPDIIPHCILTIKTFLLPLPFENFSGNIWERKQFLTTPTWIYLPLFTFTRALQVNTVMSVWESLSKLMSWPGPSWPKQEVTMPFVNAGSDAGRARTASWCLCCQDIAGVHPSLNWIKLKHARKRCAQDLWQPDFILVAPPSFQ